jgi:hypothetical protein
MGTFPCQWSNQLFFDVFFRGIGMLQPVFGAGTPAACRQLSAQGRTVRADHASRGFE